MSTCLNSYYQIFSGFVDATGRVVSAVPKITEALPPAILESGSQVTAAAMLLGSNPSFTNGYNLMQQVGNLVYSSAAVTPQLISAASETLKPYADFAAKEIEVTA